MTNPLDIKKNVSEWANEQWENKVKNPLANKTQELENSAINQVNNAWNKYSPTNYYWKIESFYRGLFWIAVLLLLILWLISG